MKAPRSIAKPVSGTVRFHYAKGKAGPKARSIATTSNHCDLETLKRYASGKPIFRPPPRKPSDS